MIADVVIAGGGPNGLMLACELKLAGIQSIVLERLLEPSDEPKANGLLGQVVRLIDHRGLYERLSGNPGPPRPNSAYFMFGAMTMNLSLLPASPVFGLAVPQRQIVQVLEERAVELGVEIRRGHEIVGLSQDDETVTVDATGPEGGYQLQARFVVGADGAHSATRKLSGIDFPGITYDRRTNRTAHVTIPGGWVDPATGGLIVPGYGTILPFLPHRTDHGGFSYAPFPGHPPLVSTTEWDQPETGEPMTLDELWASVRRVLGADLPLDLPTGDGPHVLRRLTGGNTRVATHFRDRRVFLVGDAAHVYASAGGPGLNLGLQDAVNLGWKLAAQLHGTATSALLDTYETERRQAADRMVVNAQAQSALMAPGDDITGLRELFTELLTHQPTVQLLADLTAGTDVRYPTSIPDPHPAVGHFTPDLHLQTPAGPTRLAELTRSARPLLLDLTPDATFAKSLATHPTNLEVVTAQPAGTTPTSLSALLLRPDCYVAWASTASDPSPAELEALEAAIHDWFGVPTA